MRGYFSIGVINPKTEVNVGTLWRSAQVLGASYIFTIGRRYKRQASDTYHAAMHLPLFHFDDFDSFYRTLAHGCILVGVETGEEGKPIRPYNHMPRASYLLGAEDNGIPPDVLKRCHHRVYLPGAASLNVAVAGSLVMYDRLHKLGDEAAQEAAA